MVRERSAQLAAIAGGGQALLRFTLEALVAMLDARETRPGKHSVRTRDLAVTCWPESMGIDGEELEAIASGAFLHDIGKIGIPDAILLKPGPLSPEEWEVMKHALARSATTSCAPAPT